MAHAPSRILIDAEALAANWRWLAARSGPAACGAAVKADGYGLGAREVATHLQAAGCRDFFVATWAEAEALVPALEGAALSVLHGFAEEDLASAIASPARPVLNTPHQVRRWREAAPGRPCDVMIDTGISRLGLSPADVASGLLEGLTIETLMSHLACGDEDHALNEKQRTLIASLAAAIPARRRSLANSAGICLGADYAFDLTRPGLAIYGGIPRGEAEGHIAQVARVEAQILQRRTVAPGESVGYNATFTAAMPSELAILNIGYADGYLRSFSGGAGHVLHAGLQLPVCGRVSMDLTAVDVTAAPHLREGDWLELDYNLPTASAASGLSQYELLTGLGRRHARIWR
ncbi:MAG TPA: alanine racemase [Allosphingosinicella sp.]